MEYKDMKEVEMYKGIVDYEPKNICKTLKRWESLNYDDLIYTANCIKAAGVNNYYELRIWEVENPDKGFAKRGNEAKIIKNY